MKDDRADTNRSRSSPEVRYGNVSCASMPSFQHQYLHENMTTADVAERAEEKLPNATVKLIDEAGHLLMLERPAVFREHLGSFLND